MLISFVPHTKKIHTLLPLPAILSPPCCVGLRRGKADAHNIGGHAVRRTREPPALAHNLLCCHPPCRLQPTASRPCLRCFAKEEVPGNVVWRDRRRVGPTTLVLSIGARPPSATCASGSLAGPVFNVDRALSFCSACGGSTTPSGWESGSPSSTLPLLFSLQQTTLGGLVI